MTSNEQPKQKDPKLFKTRLRTQQPTIEQMTETNKITRVPRKEGINTTNISQQKRQRKPTDRLQH